MKLAISIPDPVFQAAERVAKAMRISRSRFYAKAVEEYVRANSDEDVTRALNKVYSGEPSNLDPAWEAASMEVLRREKW